MTQEYIRRIIELSEFENQNDAHEMQDHLEKINELAKLLQKQIVKEQDIARSREPWLTNGNNDFDQGPPTGWI